jgi:hypothetical protein
MIGRDVFAAQQIIEFGQPDRQLVELALHAVFMVWSGAPGQGYSKRIGRRGRRRRADRR